MGTRLEDMPQESAEQRSCFDFYEYILLEEVLDTDQEAGGMGSWSPISSATASTPAIKSPIFSGLQRVT